MITTLLILSIVATVCAGILTAAAIITGASARHIPETPIDTTTDPSDVWLAQAKDSQR